MGHPGCVVVPRNVRVDAATERYQILSWDAPAFGNPDSYTLAISDSLHHLHATSCPSLSTRHRLDTRRTCFQIQSTRRRSQLSRGVRGSPSIGPWKRTRLIGPPSRPTQRPTTSPRPPSPSHSSKSSEVPSRVHLVFEAKDAPWIVEITCANRCMPGGEPVCFWDGASAQQFYQGDEPACLCHPGFTGRLCKEKGASRGPQREGIRWEWAWCVAEECGGTVAYTGVGPTVWRPTRVNSTAFAMCPYGPTSVSPPSSTTTPYSSLSPSFTRGGHTQVRLTRRCYIDNIARKPVWSLIDLTYSNQCVKKVSRLYSALRTPAHGFVPLAEHAVDEVGSGQPGEPGELPPLLLPPQGIRSKAR